MHGSTATSPCAASRPTKCPLALLYQPRSYENIVQIRCLLDGVSPEEMLQGWHDMLPAAMQRWGLDRGEVRRPGPLGARSLPLRLLRLACRASSASLPRR